MSDMSFKQAKELVEKIDLAEISLRNTIKDVERASNSFNDSLRQQKMILDIIPTLTSKVDLLKTLLILNVGFLLGLIAGKFIL